MVILFEDYYLLAVCKPAGLSTEGGEGQHPSVEAWARAYMLTQHPRANVASVRAVHRLDRPVGGVLLLAKTKAALTDLMGQFEQKSVQKTYWAAVKQIPVPPAGILRHWLGRSPDGRSASVFEVERPKTAYCELPYSTLKSEADRTLLEVSPPTGRFHQIRAQLSAAGCPIIGDVRYGGIPWLPDQIQLYARRLSFRHPKTGAAMVLEAEAAWF